MEWPTLAQAVQVSKLHALSIQCVEILGVGGGGGMFNNNQHVYLLSYVNLSEHGYLMK